MRRKEGGSFKTIPSSELNEDASLESKEGVVELEEKKSPQTLSPKHRLCPQAASLDMWASIAFILSICVAGIAFITAGCSYGIDDFMALFLLDEKINHVSFEFDLAVIRGTIPVIMITFIGYVVNLVLKSFAVIVESAYRNMMPKE